MAQWVNDPVCLCGGAGLIPSLVQWVKDPVLLRLWCRSQLWLGSKTWPGNFHVLWVQPEKKKKATILNNLKENIFVTKKK